MMATQLEFVNGFQPNRATRRRIRSHAMKGKNLGKTVHRSSKLRLLNKQPKTERHSDKSTSDDSPLDRQAAPQDVLRIPRNFNNMFLTCTFPVELTPASLQVVNQFFVNVLEKMYPSRIGLSSEQAKYVWLRVMFTDEAGAYIHRFTCHKLTTKVVLEPVSLCSIALMDACNEFFLGGNLDAPRGLHYLSQVLNLVNGRLRSKDALNDSTLALVVSLILQEEMRNEMSRADVHFAGLKKMIQLRGGLEQLEGNKTLVLKVCKMDICYSFAHGTPASFPRDEMPHPTQRSKQAAFNAPKGVETYLCNILMDTMNFTTLINQHPGSPVYDTLTFQETVSSICYRLLRFRSLEAGSQVSDTEALLHIGLIIFMMTVFLQFDNRRIWHFDPVTDRLRAVLAGTQDSGCEKDTKLLLWVKLVGAIWVVGSDDDQWLLRELRTTIQQLGVNEFNQIFKSIKGFPWITTAHDGPAWSVWNLLQKN